MVEDILQAVTLGPIFPVLDKKPLIKDWPNAATCDETQIRAWWTRWPGASIGLVTGVRSGLYVVDVDPRKGGTSDGLPETLTASTISGGTHHYYRHVPGLGNRANIVTGVDTRGDGGYVVVPPSTGYAWTTQIEVAPVPPWIAAMNGSELPKVIEVSDASSYAQSALAGCCEAIRVAQSGERNNVLNQQAFKVGRYVGGGYLDQGQAVEELWRAAQDVGLPISEKKSLFSGIEAGKRIPVELKSKPATASQRRFVLTKASTIKPRRVRWGWESRMPVGELCLIPGREGIGKSLFLAWLAAELTKGTLPGEFYGTPKGVLIATSEDSWSYTIVPRLMAAGADLEMVFRVEIDEAESGKLILPRDIGMIPEMAMQVDAAALMCDPIISLIDDDLSVNQSRELRKALEPLRNAAEKAEIMIPALAHFNKTDTDVMSKIPGARAWAEVCRAAIALAHDKDAGQHVLSQVKNNLGRLELPNLTYDIEEVFIETVDGPGSYGKLIWTGETDTTAEEVLTRKPDKQEDKNLSNATTTYRVINFVTAIGRVVTIQDVVEALPDIKQDTIKRILSRAAREGTLSNPARGQYGTPGVSP